MEFFSNHSSFFFLLLITLLSSCQIHARDSQFFNKIPTTTNNDHIEKKTKKVVTPNKNQEPNSMPKNKNAYDVYGHDELGHELPPSTPTTNLIPNNKYLPKNYNSVAYVTVPQYNTDETNSMNSDITYDDNNNNNFNNNNNQRYNSGRGSSYHDHYYIGDNTYDNNDHNNNNNEYYIDGNTYDHYYKSDSTYNSNDNNNNNQYYNSIDTYNDQYHDNGDRADSKVIMTTSIEPSLNGDGHEYYYINNNHLQDMIEPRLMDKGAYATTSYKNGGNDFYYNHQEQSPNTKKYVKNPYENNSREFANSYIGNNELTNNNNNFVNYENEEEFQDEEHMP